jgi:uncharacterized membrane protein YcjF (UPF0283 family)
MRTFFISNKQGMQVIGHYITAKIGARAASGVHGGRRTGIL